MAFMFNIDQNAWPRSGFAPTAKPTPYPEPGIRTRIKRNMYKVLATFVISAAVAFAAASWIYTADREAEQPASARPMASAFNDSLPVEERILALEQAVSEERTARQLLQEEVFYLTSELERLSGNPDYLPAEEPEDKTGDVAETESRSSRRAEWLRRNSPEYRIERLVDAGFLPSQAAAIARRESELQMESIQARYDAERSGDPVDFWRSRNEIRDTLRSELGDADYERYLLANDRSISVTVSSVIDSSPAQAAGLQPGDEILRYDGRRVFDMSDLTREALNGNAGENIVVDVVRDGTQMQVVLPRGPVGITGGRRPW